MEESFVKEKQKKDDEEKHISSNTRSDVIIDCHTKEEEEEEAAPTIVEEAPLRQKTKRVATLDAFRGLTIVVSEKHIKPKLNDMHAFVD